MDGLCFNDYMDNLTFDDLTKLEPQLKVLYDQAGAVEDDGSTEFFNRNRFLYDLLKPRLFKLVGFGRRPKHRLGLLGDFRITGRQPLHSV